MGSQRKRIRSHLFLNICKHNMIKNRRMYSWGPGAWINGRLVAGVKPASLEGDGQEENGPLLDPKSSLHSAVTVPKSERAVPNREPSPRAEPGLSRPQRWQSPASSAQGLPQGQAGGYTPPVQPRKWMERETPPPKVPAPS